ncbi:MAG: type II toxin-antitoxin system RelE/ParE family toxin [Byssovorax sp.]
MTPVRFHESARRERLQAKRRYTARDPRLAARFDLALRHTIGRIREAPSQFPEHALLAVPTPTGSLFFAIRRALLPRPFPHLIFFYLREGAAIVLAIAHPRRRPSYWSTRR